MIYPPNKTLILSVHMDDEILSCGGTINVIRESCRNYSSDFPPKIDETLYIYYFNGAEHPASQVDNKTYKIENQELLKRIGCFHSFSKNRKMNLLETVPMTDHVSEIEELINSFNPHTIIVPFPDYNADHRRIYDAAITATRVHDQNWFVPNILIAEQVCTVQTNRVFTQFIPTVFVPIDIEAKLKLWSFYGTQHRGHRTPDMIRALAATRGLQCNVPYAEAFMPVRIVID